MAGINSIGTGEEKGGQNLDHIFFSVAASNYDLQTFASGLCSAVLNFAKLSDTCLRDINLFDTDGQRAHLLANCMIDTFTKHVSKELSQRPAETTEGLSSETSGAAVRTTNGDDKCAICLEDYKQPKKLDKCGHVFCKHCIEESFQKTRPECPQCRTIYGKLTGSQPENGKMIMCYEIFSLSGFAGGRYAITYDFPSGRQTEAHPHPGRKYTGTSRTAFLPDTREGRTVLMLLKTAFDRRLIFTVGQSATTGETDVVTWNDIHHKTAISGGPEKFGYPDPDYLLRVKDELAAKGVTEEDLTDTQKDFIQHPGSYRKGQYHDFSYRFGTNK